jgi:hypothetical protein
MIAKLIEDADALYKSIDKYINSPTATLQTAALTAARGMASDALGQLHAHAQSEADAAEKAKAATPPTAPVTAETPKAETVAPPVT